MYLNIFMLEYDIFISHSWGYDLKKRENHERCRKLCNKLKVDGFNVWFDEYNLYGNIDSSIMNAIRSSRIILICLTKKYYERLQ